MHIYPKYMRPHSFLKGSLTLPDMSLDTTCVLFQTKIRNSWRAKLKVTRKITWQWNSAIYLAKNYGRDNAIQAFCTGSQAFPGCLLTTSPNICSVWAQTFQIRGWINLVVRQYPTRPLNVFDLVGEKRPSMLELNCCARREYQWVDEQSARVTV